MHILIRIVQNENFANTKSASVILEWQSVHVANLWTPKSLNNPGHSLNVAFVNDLDVMISQDTASQLSIVVWF